MNRYKEPLNKSSCFSFQLWSDCSYDKIKITNSLAILFYDQQQLQCIQRSQRASCVTCGHSLYHSDSDDDYDDDDDDDDDDGDDNDDDDNNGDDNDEFSESGLQT
uniref:Uncharacterized protein n=1 Tax=Glossina austeni TaxID=7395 RepID=A0A1A9UEV8_GLOAU